VSLSEEVKGIFDDRVNDLTLIIFICSCLVEAASYESCSLGLKEWESFADTG
jgi:hypothetical protein